jgi:hypothetical protein
VKFSVIPAAVSIQIHRMSIAMNTDFKLEGKLLKEKGKKIEIGRRNHRLQ